MKYRLQPKEIPLAADEAIVCEVCGLAPPQGKHSTRFFDYEPIRGADELHPRKPG
jgi:hypothetical protein